MDTIRTTAARGRKPTAPLDLVQPALDPWAGIEVPPDWEPIVRICRRVYQDLSELTGRIVALIEEEIPGYRHATVPRTDVAASVFRNIEMILVGLAQNRGPLPPELTIRRELGRRRAQQGLPADALLQAYHVGYRELWQALVAAAQEEDPETLMLLLTAVTTVWGWIHEVTDAVAEAHHETTRDRELLAATMRQRFFDLLASGDVDSEEFVELARSQGFDLEGHFQALCIGISPDDERVRDALPRAVGRMPGCQYAGQARDALILVQDAKLKDVESAVRGVVSTASIGIGLRRIGPQGARLSIGDAERALAIAAPGETRAFEEDWIDASLLASHDRLRDLFAHGQRVAEAHPELADTVRAFAGSGFSLASTARLVNVHPNTVTYRLDRWQALTGWDPRSYTGLTRSMVTLRIHQSLGQSESAP